MTHHSYSYSNGSGDGRGVDWALGVTLGAFFWPAAPDLVLLRSTEWRSSCRYHCAVRGVPAPVFGGGSARLQPAHPSAPVVGTVPAAKKAPAENVVVTVSASPTGAAPATPTPS